MLSTVTKAQLIEMAHIAATSDASPWSFTMLSHSVAVGHHFMLLEAEAIKAYLIYSYVLEEAELLYIVVSQQYKRSGCGTQLLKQYCDCLRELSIASVHLEVRADNHAAIACYEQSGFVMQGRRKGYYQRPVADALLFKKELVTC